jgi:hypothetical protein
MVLAMLWFLPDDGFQFFGGKQLRSTAPPTERFRINWFGRVGSLLRVREAGQLSGGWRGFRGAGCLLVYLNAFRRGQAWWPGAFTLPVALGDALRLQ